VYFGPVMLESLAEAVDVFWCQHTGDGTSGMPKAAVMLA
jgi:hypothetical protein